MVTDGNQVVEEFTRDNYNLLSTQDHTRQYFIEKLTAHYATLPIHTVAYQCDDDRYYVSTGCIVR